MGNFEKTTGNTADEVVDRLTGIYKRGAPLDADHYIDLIERSNIVLLNEAEEIRPRDSSGLPGGLIFLKRDIPTVIVPDLHARMNFLLSVYSIPLKMESASLLLA